MKTHHPPISIYKRLTWEPNTNKFEVKGWKKNKFNGSNYKRGVAILISDKFKLKNGTRQRMTLIVSMQQESIALFQMCPKAHLVSR